MEFRILGPLEVVKDGRQVDVGGAKQRALLAMLLLTPNRVVSAGRLIDALWDENLPENARKTLQVYVSQLRKAIGKERIETRGPGYVIHVGPDELDLERAQRLATAGEHESALAEFRGHPLADFEGERFASAEAARLEELRLAYVENRIAADLAAGRDAALVGELDALVAEYPVRERLREHLMLALYRSGRQAEALEAFQDARRALVDELGIEPGRSLRDLHQAILRQDPALDPTPQRESAAEVVEPPVGRSTETAQEPRRAKRKTVTVVHVLVAIGRDDDESIDPEIVSRLTTRALDEVTEAVHAHGGSLESVTGDAASAVFGLPAIHEDDPLRAVRAAAEIQRRLAPEHELVIRVGVSTGAVVTGDEATRNRLRATGEPFRKAAQLAQEAAAGDVRVDEATRRFARADRGDSSRFSSPMVGRGRERRRLHDAFAQAAGDRSCQLFTVLGAAGVGKSRLVHEFLGDLEGQARVARGRCLPYGEGITYWPLIEAVRELAGLEAAESADESRAKLVQLAQDAEDANLVVERVGEVIGLAETPLAGEESAWAVRTFFEAIAEQGPLVLVLDDIHWGEPTFLDLVDHISDWSRDAPILLLCIARPDLLDARPDWGGGKLNSTSVLLEPLSEEDSAQLIDNLAGAASLDESARRRIVDAADGNPLFVEEMLAFMLENGTSNGLEMPPTIHALLAARLDRLAADERAAIEAASVEGKVFHESAVAELVSAQVSSAARAQLLALARRELIRPDRPLFTGMRAFRFRHLLIRDAAYAAIPKESRASLHERYADWLEQQVAERGLEFEEILGYHLEQAFLYRAELGRVEDGARELADRAGKRLAAAGRRALTRGDVPAAINLLSRAATLLSPDDPARVHLVPTVRAVQGLGSELGWAEAVLREAVESEDVSLRTHARVQQALLQLFTDDDAEVDALEEVATEAIRVFERAGDDLGLARSWRLLQQARYLGRHAALSPDAAEVGLTHARRVNDRLEEIEIVSWLGVALFMGATPVQEALARVEALRSQVHAGRAVDALLLSSLAALHAMQGRLPEARSLLDRARDIVDDLGYLSQLAVVPFYVGEVELLGDEPGVGEDALRQSLGPLEEMGETSTYCSIVATLAETVYRDGRYEEAEELTAVSERAARRNDVHAHITWKSVRAKSLAQRGAFVEAEELSREAIEYAATGDFLNAHGDALLSLAVVLELAGRPEEAIPAVEEALLLYERKGNVVSAARSAELLKHLAGRAGAENGRGRA